MDKGDVIFLIAVIMLIAIGSGVLAYYDGYKNGQIDALNGEIYYELVEQDNKETEWKYIPQN